MSTYRCLPLARGRMVTLRLSPTALFIATVALVASAWGTRQVGGSVVPGGLLDESVHLLTTLLVLWALGRTACERFLVPALAASVLIDVDHIPDRLGNEWLTSGTPRPYPHSLLTIGALLIAAILWRHRRDVLVGVAIGVALHLWWDLAESNSGASLLWPFSYRSFTLPFASYVFPMILAVGVAAYRTRASTAAERPRGPS